MYCYLCGQGVKEGAENCPRCKANLTKKTEKVILGPSLSSYEKFKLRKESGCALLTNERFILYSNNFLKGVELKVNIPLKEISNIEIKKYVIGKSIIINTKNGASYIVGPTKIEDWQKAIQEVIS